MNSVPKPVPMKQVKQDTSGINFISKVHDGVAYWGIRHVSVSGELVEELKGSMPLHDKQNLHKLGKIVKEYSKETGLPLRYSGSQDKYKGYGLQRDTVLVLSEENKLERLIEEELRSAYEYVEIYTDASWSTTSTVQKRMGYGWCIRYGHAGKMGHGTYNKIQTKLTERYALITGLKNNYQNIYKYGGKKSTIVVRTDSMNSRDWAIRALKHGLRFEDLPDNDLYQFFTKAIKRHRDHTGPRIRFEWVKSHDGDIWNRTVDSLAVNARTGRGSYSQIEQMFFKNVRHNSPVRKQ